MAETASPVPTPQHPSDAKHADLARASEVISHDEPPLVKDPGAPLLPVTSTGSIIEEEQAHPEFDQQLDDLGAGHDLDPNMASLGSALGVPHISEPSTSTGSRTSKWKTAMGEVKHFAGGLVNHPFESTKHFSVLRHSHGLVYYQGPSTRVAITVFSDQPLPADRKIWLQKRGFSGKTGLKVGAVLGTRSAWIDVTPAVDARPDVIAPADERAWQRDISKFLKHAREDKIIRHHRPDETDVIRVPHSAEDGYFRVVLCAGRKVLCPSPIFRYVSASLDPGRIRGASLSSLPLELGIKIGAFVGRQQASAVTSTVLSPITTAYQNNVQPVIDTYNPAGLTQMAAEEAYNESGAAERVDTIKSNVDQRYTGQVDLEHTRAGGDDHVPTTADHDDKDDGPKSPFPISFSAKVVAGTGKSRQITGLPSANLVGIPATTLDRLSGVYVAWVRLSLPKKESPINIPDTFLHRWYQARVTATPVRDRVMKVTDEKDVSVYIVHDFGSHSFVGVKTDVLLVDFLRPIRNADDVGDIQMQMVSDIAVVQQTLDRPKWSSEAIAARQRADAAQRSLVEKAGDAWSYGQRQIDRVPVHRLGVRTESVGLRDRLIGTGGICIKR